MPPSDPAELERMLKEATRERWTTGERVAVGLFTVVGALLLPASIWVTDIDGRSVAHGLAAKGAEGLSPGTVSKLKAIMGRSFSLGARWGVAGCERNPVRAVLAKPLNNERDRSLSAEEAARLREACRASRNPMLLPIVHLLLATGCRLRELLDARWEHVVEGRRWWFVPTSKNGQSRHVPLSGAALETIAGLPRYEGCPWLVPNPETLRPFVTIKNAWHFARDAAGLPGLRLHDCRHAAASALVSTGVDLYAVGRILGHRSVASSACYAHHSRDALLSAVQAGAAKLAVQPA